MRGSPHGHGEQQAENGIIPAHAGLTAAVSVAHRQDQDHPRACGAHEDVYGGIVLRPGSSPRMRGSHYQQSKPSYFPGIIPAHAGLTGF